MNAFAPKSHHFVLPCLVAHCERVAQEKVKRYWTGTIGANRPALAIPRRIVGDWSCASGARR
jgi:hypothetical protein